MKTQTKLLRIVTPPPIGVNNLLKGENLQATTTKALSLHIQKNVPSCGIRNVAHKVHLVTIHPSQPLVTYLLVPEGTDGASGNKSSKKSMYPKSVIVQHLKTRQVIYSISLGDIATQLFQLDVLGDEKLTASRQAKLLKDLGQVQGLQFVDPSTLYWSGFYEWAPGQQNSSSSSFGRSSSSNGQEFSPGDFTMNGGSSRSSSSNNHIDPLFLRFSYVVVQFTNRIIVLNIRKGSKHIVSSIKKPSIPKAFLPIQAHITQDLVSGSPAAAAGAAGGPGSMMISSNPLPISQHVILLATSDGSIKVYDWSKKLVLKTFKNVMPVKQSKNDTIVYLCPTNKFTHYWNGIVSSNDGDNSSSIGGGGGIGSAPATSSGGGFAYPTTGENTGASIIQKRFVMLTKKGVAYLMEMIMNTNIQQLLMKLLHHQEQDLMVGLYQQVCLNKMMTIHQWNIY